MSYSPGQVTDMTVNGNGRKRGRPTLCTPENVAKITQAIRCGMPIERACEYGGIGKTTYHMWQEQAHEAIAARANGTTLSDTQQAYVNFLDQLHQAHRDAEINLAQLLVDAATPHPVRTTTLRRVVLKDGNRIVRDNQGNPIFVDETIVTETVQYDWRAGKEILSKRFRERWGDQLALTGADGGPIALSMPEQSGDAQALGELRAAYIEAGLLPALPAPAEESDDESDA
jgi:hypothetical protein